MKNNTAAALPLFFRTVARSILFVHVLFVVVLIQFGFVASTFAGVAPIILEQPTNTFTPAGQYVCLTVVPEGEGPLHLQWRHNGTNIYNNGYGSNQCCVFALGSASGDYLVIVSNAFGSVTSTVATLSVIDPVMILNPTNITTDSGLQVEMLASAMGTWPIGFQWFKDGVPFDLPVEPWNFGWPEGWIGPNIVRNARAFDAGDYFVIASNSFGSVTSSVATLEVRPYSIEPFLFRSFTNSYFNGALCRFENKLLVGARDGLTVWDVTDPADPWLEGGCVSSFPTRISVGESFGSRFALAATGSNVLIFDINFWEDISHVGTYPLDGYIMGLAVTNHFAYVATYSRLTVLDLSDLTAPQPVTVLSNDYSGLTLAGEKIFALGFHSIDILDISNREQPVVASTLPTAGRYPQLALHGDRAYVVSCADWVRFWCRTSILEIFDVSNPTQPNLLGTHSLADLPSSIHADARFLYVISTPYSLEGGTPTTLTVWDVSRPEQITRAGGLELVFGPLGTILSGNHFYIGTDYEIRVLQLAPSLAITFSLEGPSLQVSADVNRPYILERKSSLTDLWQPLQTLVMSNHSQTIVLSNSLQSFYRLRTSP